MSSTIRCRFVERMEFVGLSKHTQRSYVAGVKGLANYYKRSPEALTDDQVRAYFRHLIMERKLARASCYAYLSGIIFFYRHLCSREVNDRFGLPPRRKSKKLPPVLSIEEVGPLLSSIDNLKHRVLLKTIYSINSVDKCVTHSTKALCFFRLPSHGQSSISEHPVLLTMSPI